MDFELLLVILVGITGLLSFIDVFWFASKRKLAKARLADINKRHPSYKEVAEFTKIPRIFDYARSFFPILLFVLLLRSFLVEPFRIPSGSLEPTLVVGDLIVTNKFSYGLRLPVLHTKLVKVGEPKRGDIVVFRWPPDPSIDYIKRVVGLPGDHITYIDKVLYVNGVAATQSDFKETTNTDDQGNTWPVVEAQEDLLGIKHEIFLRPDMPAQNISVVVPPGQYFMMGDNRDDSYDSRSWGFVPEQNLVGRAFAIWFSWDNTDHRIRWSRIGELIH